MTNPVPNNSYSVATGAKSNNTFITYVDTRDPTVDDRQFPVGKYWLNKNTGNYFYLNGFTGANLNADWIVVSPSNVGGVITINNVSSDGTGNFTIESSDSSINVTPIANGLSITTSTSGGVTSVIGTSPVNVSPTTGTPVVSLGTVSEAHGGTNQTTYTTGDILYASGANTLSKLGIGSGGQVLTVNSGLPSWQTGVSIQTGTFSPTVAFTGQTVAPTYTASLHYTQIGNVVYLNCAIGCSNKGTAPANAQLIVGLNPLPISLIDTVLPTTAIGITFTTSSTYFLAVVPGGTRIVTLQQWPVNGGAQGVDFSSFATAFDITFTGFYFTS